MSSCNFIRISNIATIVKQMKSIYGFLLSMYSKRQRILALLGLFPVIHIELSRSLTILPSLVTLNSVVERGYME